MWPVAASFAFILELICCFHVVRTRQELYWIFVILVIQPFGVIVYAVAVLLPDILGGARGRRLGRRALETLDPTRAYREAQQAVEDSPTVYNRMQLAAAASVLGRHEEAAHLYALCSDGIYADDPAILLRYANSLVELERYREAVPILEKLGDLGDVGRTPEAALLLGRAREGLGDDDSAERAYVWAADRIAGLEGLARHVVYLTRQGRLDEARGQYELLDKRFARIPKAFRRDEGRWHTMAARAIADAAAQH